MRPLRILLWLLATLAALPLVAAAAILALLNTAPGRTLAEHQIAARTNGAVTLKGLSGRFPDHLRLAHLTLNDAAGPWLQAEDIALDWSPTALIHHQALIHRLHIAALAITRTPQATPSTPPAPQPTQPFTLPLRITAEHATIARASIAAPLAPQPATLALSAQLDLPAGPITDLAALPSATMAIQAQTLAPSAPTAAYALTAHLTPDRIEASLTLQEPEHGPLAAAAALPAIGALDLKATIAGPRNNLASTLTLSAGPLSAAAQGAIDLAANTAVLDITAGAPAMRPAPGLAWRSITLKAHLSGPVTAPEATAHLQIEGIEAANASLQSLAADLSANAGAANLTATATALHLPIPNGDLFQSTPLHLQASTRLDDPAHPTTYALTHPLLTLTGTAQIQPPQTQPSLNAEATLTIPDLAPLAATAGTQAAGHTRLALHLTGPQEAPTLTIDGPLTLTAPPPAAALIGEATIGLTAHRTPTALSLTRLTLQSPSLDLTAAATLETPTPNTPTPNLEATAHLTTPNLATLAPTLQGPATLDLHAAGPLDAFALEATATATIAAPAIATPNATHSQPPTPIRLAATLQDLPNAPTGHIDGTGDLLGSPIHLSLDAARNTQGALTAKITQADWRSLHAEGAMTLPPNATIPSGTARLRIATLEDLRPLLGQPIAGALTADLVLDPAALTLDAQATNAHAANATAAQTSLKLRIATPADHPQIAATLTAQGIAAGSVSGTARLEAAGPPNALALRATASGTVAGTGATLAATATLDTAASRLRLTTLEASAHAETLRLLTPATLTYAPGVSLDRLRLGLRQATLDIAGRLIPTLDATIALRTPADLAAALDPNLAIDGAVTLDAKLTGPPAQPNGTLKLAASGLRLRTGPGRSLPPASLTATAQLAAGSATIDARLAAGTSRLAVTGQAPLGAGPLNLHADGALDLAILNPILGAQGYAARGRVTLNGAASGPATAPRLTGQATLADGALQSAAQGLRLSAIAAALHADGDTIRIDSLTARAGPGTITATGSFGIAPAAPVDVAITLRNARPIASDQVTADLDADLTLKGALQSGLVAAGHIRINRAELRIPDTIPPSVVTLNVRRPGARPAPVAPATPIAVTLNLVVDAPAQVFVRGRGLDTEMAGFLTIRGPATRPQVGGGLELRRGAISLAGTTLTFSRGKIGFDGAGAGVIDPTLDFAADSTAAGVTATLSIGGYVSKPKITLSSVPDLPQDEVLAYLIFKRGAKDLGPFQIAQIAAALADLTGVTPAGFNPLESIRKGLGLDRMSVGSTAAPTGSTAAASPTLEGGRYIANGVYVGAKQGLTGGQTQATVQIDITKGLKLETDVGAGASNGQGGNQVGLTYQFEY